MYISTRKQKKNHKKRRKKIKIQKKCILYTAFCCIIYNPPLYNVDYSLYTQDTSRYIKIYLTEIHKEEVDLGDEIGHSSEWSRYS